MADTMQNINLNLSTKKKFTIDGDPNRVIELDISDINIINRATTAFKNIENLKNDWEKLPTLEELDSDNVDTEILHNTVDKIDEFSDEFSAIENQLKNEIDFMFDSPISNTIFGTSSPFSIVNDKFKFEHTIDVLMSLYEEQLQGDLKKLNKSKVVNKTRRYIKK